MKEYALLAVALFVCGGAAWGLIEFVNWCCERFGAWCDRVFEDDDSY